MQSAEENVPGKEQEEGWGGESGWNEKRWNERPRGEVEGNRDPDCRGCSQNQTNRTLQISQAGSAKKSKLIRFLRKVISLGRFLMMSVQEKQVRAVRFIKSLSCVLEQVKGITQTSLNHSKIIAWGTGLQVSPDQRPGSSLPTKKNNLYSRTVKANSTVTVKANCTYLSLLTLQDTHDARNGRRWIYCDLVKQAPLYVLICPDFKYDQKWSTNRNNTFLISSLVADKPPTLPIRIPK